jgi:hypothetical protein
MARTNYSFEKRQRELAKRKKKEEKRLKKVEKASGKAPSENPSLADNENTSI